MKSNIKFIKMISQDQESEDNKKEKRPQRTQEGNDWIFAFRELKQITSESTIP